MKNLSWEFDSKVDLKEFLYESNRIEGINSVTKREITVSMGFLELDKITVKDVENLVNVFEPGAKIRDQIGMNVTVGDYSPTAGGPHVPVGLEYILSTVATASPIRVHRFYENLHPFMDGNGRSGRMIWLWQMLNYKYDMSKGFLLTFYYQTLAERLNEILVASE